jgi:hypothetical protein
MKYKIFTIILTILIYGCEKESDPCEMAIKGENYTLSDSADHI